MIHPLSPSELQARIAAGETLQLVDVREPSELRIAQLPDVIHIPLGELQSRAGELDPDRPTVCICHHGVRSAHAAGFLTGLDFKVLFNLTGGMEAWALEVDPQMPRY